MERDKLHTILASCLPYDLESLSIAARFLRALRAYRSACLKCACDHGRVRLRYPVLEDLGAKLAGNACKTDIVLQDNLLARQKSQSPFVPIGVLNDRLGSPCVKQILIRGGARDVFAREAFQVGLDDKI